MGTVYIENRFVSFMNFMVARRMTLLSWSFMESFPYKYNFSLLDRWFKLFLIKIGITSVASNVLLFAWNGHLNKKCFVSSSSKLQRHLAEGVSTKLWWYLWLLRGLKPNLSWNNNLIPVGSWILKILLFWGRKNEKRWVLSTLYDGIFVKFLIKMFQDATASGKKLIMNLSVLLL